MFAALAILCGATYLGLNTGLRYTQAEAGLGPDVVPPADLRHWPKSRARLDFTLDNGVAIARLGPAGDGQAAALQARLIPGAGTDAFRITLDAGARAIEDGAETWQRARVQLLSFDAGGRFLWYWPKTIATLSGDRPFRSVSAVVPMTPEVAFTRLVIYNGARSGELRVGPPRVEALAERPAFAALRWTLVLAWFAYGAWIAHALARRAAGPMRAGLLLGVGLIALFGALMPQPVFRTVSAPLEAGARSLADALFAPVPAPAPVLQPPPDAGPGAAMPARPEAPEHQLVPAPAAPETDYPFSFKQLSHFAVFFLLGLAAVAAFPRVPRTALLACLGAFAVSTEALQLFVVTRSGTLADLAFDAAGLALAALAAAAWITVLARARRRARAGPGASP